MNQIKDFFLSCKECVLENPRSFYGSFSLGPFQNSQSLTIANALRRTLLTEITNIAVTHVEIEGVLHEYSTIVGVRESALDILLNFRQIVLKSSCSLSKPVFGYLNVRGPGIIRAVDLKLPPGIQYVDPDQYIATLSENGTLSLKFQIFDSLNSVQIFKKKSDSKKFNNFEKAPENFNQLSFQKQSFEKIQTFSVSEKTSFQKKKKTNSLWVDPNFHPILKVSYIIENLPLGEFQNQVIFLEIWTNGSIHPRKALYLTFDFLKNIFHKFDDMKSLHLKLQSGFFESEETLTKILKAYEYDFGFQDQTSSFFKKKNVLLKESNFENSNKERTSSALKEDGFQKNQKKGVPPFNQFEEKRSMSIENLGLPNRIQQALLQNNLRTIGDLLNLSAKEFKNLSGIGNFSLALLQKKLKNFGFFLKAEKELSNEKNVKSFF